VKKRVFFLKYQPNGPTRPAPSPPRFLVRWAERTPYLWRVQNLNPPRQKWRDKRANPTGPTHLVIPYSKFVKYMYSRYPRKY